MGGLPKKAGRAWTVCRFKRGFGKKEEGSVFEGDDTPIHTMHDEGIQTQRLDKVAANNKKFIKYLHSNIKWQLKT